MIESLFLYVLGNPNTKSKLTSSYGAFGTGSGVYKPVLFPPVLAIMHTTHLLTDLAISISSLDQKKFVVTKARVSDSLKCPSNVPPCNSSKILNLKEQDGMHRVFTFKGKFVHSHKFFERLLVTHLPNLTKMSILLI